MDNAQNGRKPLKKDDAPTGESGMPRARVASLSEVILRVTGSLDLDTVLQEIVDGACSLTDTRYSAVVLFDDSRQVQQFVTFGMNSEGCQQLGDIRDPLRLADLTRHTPPAGFPEDSPSRRRDIREGYPPAGQGDPSWEGSRHRRGQRRLRHRRHGSYRSEASAGAASGRRRCLVRAGWIPDTAALRRWHSRVASLRRVVQYPKSAIAQLNRVREVRDDQ